MNNIKVSVIVNFYNSEEYVEQCLEALMKQTLKEIEILVIDDGSTDETLKIATACAKKDSRIHVIHKTNGGLASARKTGLESARGEYVTFIDGDDWVKESMYERMYQVAIENNLDIVQCNFEPTGDYDKWKEVENSKRYEEGVLSGQTLLKMYLRRDVMPALWQRLFKNGLWRPEEFKTKSKVMSDHFNFPEWANRAKRVQIINEAYYVWLTRNGSLGRPMGDIENANAKNRFLSGISILDFSEVLNESLRDDIIFYLFSYMTQTAYHLRLGNEKRGYQLVYGLWDNLMDPESIGEVLEKLELPECLSVFFGFLISDREAFEKYVAEEFLEAAEAFIATYSYNGSDLFE